MRIIHDLDVSLPGTVGLVPTMGALHDGHGSLIARAREENDTVIVSVFVNPLQFDDAGDYRNYPRTLEADLNVAERYGADVVFAPSLETMYPGGDPEISVSTGAMGRVLEGAYRPGHFDGVATVVAKLFNILRPQRAYFGQKDAQQLAIIRRMVADLNFGIEVVAADLVRAADGLAESSRNTRLSARERRHALALPRALAALADGAELGPTCERLAAAEGVELDYLVVVDPATFSPTEHRPALALGAIHVGPVRLIDNRAV